MVINKERLGCILLFGVLLNLISNAVAYRTAVYLLCPEPAVSLECFDTLRAGMAEEEARFTLEGPWVCFIGCCMQAPPLRHREVQFRDGDLQIVLVIDDGILIDGQATVNGQVVRHQLEPRDPVLDTIRLGLRRLEQR
jgi:hypothetical protein